MSQEPARYNGELANGHATPSNGETVLRTARRSTNGEDSGPTKIPTACCRRITVQGEREAPAEPPCASDQEPRPPVTETRSCHWRVNEEAIIVFSSFFINRPIFASVLSIVIVLAGSIALFTLPVAQYPEITPPTVEVSASYPGANAQVVADTVAAPIEQQVNGVEGMMYMSSQCTNDGNYTLTVTFQPGSDLNISQVLVQNRESLAEPILPDLVKRRGISVKKKSPNVLMIVNLFATDKNRTNRDLSNYATIQIRDELSRLPGVGDITYLGQRDYSMRLWLDPTKLASYGLNTKDVIAAVQAQNIQVAAGQIGQPPTPSGQVTQYIITTLGRLEDTDQFANIILKNVGSTLVHLKDVAKIQLGAQSYDQTCTLDGKPSVALSVYQLPGSNALDVAKRVKERMGQLRTHFPPGIDYSIVYDTTPFINESISEVFKTLFDAIVLVAVVVLVFLQNWRSSLIPLIAVPVAVVGTFAVMAAIGFSLNNLTLFGLVLAIGIVVDDAIVVVEAVEHHIEHGLAPREATLRAMEQVSGPVVAIGLVLSAVFVPCMFITGITGQFFRQFALTIAVSTVISAFNSLTLSPALSALILKRREKGYFEPLPWFAFPPLGAWLGHKIISHHWMSAALNALNGSRCRRRQLESCVCAGPIVVGRGAGDAGGADPGPAAQRAARLVVPPVQPRLRSLDQRLHAHGVGAAARQFTGAAAVRRSAGADLVGLYAYANRLHSAAGQGLPAGQRATARRLLRGADPGRGPADRADRPEDEGRQAHGRDVGPVDPAQRQRLELRGAVPDAR